MSLTGGSPGAGTTGKPSTSKPLPRSGLHKCVLIKSLCNPLSGLSHRGEAYRPRVCLRHYPGLTG